MTTEAELVSQLRALGIPDWDTARWLMDEAAKRIESQAAEIERLKDVEFELRLALTRHLQSKDALLRQALDAMQWEVGGEPLPTLMMESIAAIKTHLGEARLA